MTWEMVPTPSPASSRPSRRPRSPRWAIGLIGALIARVGVALLVWPFGAGTWILAVLIGSVFISNGLALMIGVRAGGASLGGGLLLVALGVFAILFSDFTVLMLVTFVGGMLVFVGALWLIIAVRFSAARRQLLDASFDGARQLEGRRSVRSLLWMLPPVILLVGGIAALIWPSVALSIAAVGVGLVTLAIGASIVWGATRMRQAR